MSYAFLHRLEVDPHERDDVFGRDDPPTRFRPPKPTRKVRIEMEADDDFISKLYALFESQIDGFTPPAEQPPELDQRKRMLQCRNK